MKKYARLSAVLLLVLPFLLAGCGDAPDQHKVIVLGVDGMDYKLLKKWMDEGLMPNFEALAREGGFAPLGTSIPPESPVAWSNFISGQNPGGHGIFDFIHRKFDGDEIAPCNAMSDAEPVTSSMELFGYELPLAGGEAYNKRQGRAFWEVLEDHDVPATLFKIPCQCPPTETDQKTLAGMGTPDLLGTYGGYRVYTDDEAVIFSDEIPKDKVVSVSVLDNTIQDFIYGPENTLIAGDDKPIATTPLTIHIDPSQPMVKITIGEEGAATAEVILREGEWSDFVEMQFELIPYVVNISGISRFYLKEARPNFTLVLDTLNLNPSSPVSDISTPSDWVSDIADEYGPFYTVQMPENPDILKEGALTYDEFRAHSRLIYDKRKEMLNGFLDKHQSGLLFYYFCSIDLDSHMFWRCMDNKHPGHAAEEANETFIKQLYQEMDGVLGEVRKKLDQEDTLIVMSDHGFAPFYRAFHLNTWLLENGYLVLKEDADREHADLWTSVDWTKTKAYNAGFASLYLNVKGREPQGIVDSKEQDDLVNEICAKLMKFTDPKNGEKVFKTLYKSREVYSGQAVGEAPDIILGCKAEYRISDQSTIGEIPMTIIEDNLNPWSGCHVMAAEEVPGILVTNRKIRLDDPKLYDLTATLLMEYNIEKTPEMVGQPIF